VAPFVLHGSEELPGVGDPPYPELERWHRDQHVLVKEIDEGVHVIALERVDVSRNELPFAFRALS
jgi:hypothetical protein